MGNTRSPVEENISIPMLTSKQLKSRSRNTQLRLFFVLNPIIIICLPNDDYARSKVCVTEFFASDKAFRIYNKSKWHANAMEYLWKVMK